MTVSGVEFVAPRVVQRWRWFCNDCAVGRALWNFLWVAGNGWWLMACWVRDCGFGRPSFQVEASP